MPSPEPAAVIAALPATLDQPQLIGFAVALGAGLMIGIERERHKGSGPRRAFAGVRTFALAALAGAMAQALHEPWLVIVGALFIALLGVVAQWRQSPDDPGVTTEVALFVTYLLGVGAPKLPAFVAGAAVIVALLLASRSRIHAVSVELIKTEELRDGLLLAGAALVVLPLLPNSGIELLGGLNPWKLWSLVVLFMAMQAGGYIATRIAGARIGMALTGLASGFISSTATTAAMGSRSRREPELRSACVAGALFSCVSTPVLLVAVVMVVDPAAIGVVGPSMALAIAVAAVVAAINYYHQRNPSSEEQSGRMFNARHAITFALLLSGATALMSLAAARFGLAAVNIGAALAGFVDAHAAATSALALSAGDRLDRADLLLPILLGFSTNAFSKLVVAGAAGGRIYMLRVGVGLVAAVAAAWLPFFLAVK